jgi:hypothetical protein
MATENVELRIRIPPIASSTLLQILAGPSEIPMEPQGRADQGPAFSVGCESTTFSREFSRYFGSTPRSIRTRANGIAEFGVAVEASAFRILKLTG